MDKIEKIKKFVNEEADRWQDSYCDSMRDNLLAFLDALESEDSKRLEEEKGTIEAGLELIAAYSLVPYMDGNAWCYLLGDNIQEGVCGFGNTRTEALIEFVKDFTSQAGTSLPPKSEEKEVDLEEESDRMFFSLGWYEGDHHQPMLDCVSLEQFRDIARHFAMWGAEHLKK